MYVIFSEASCVTFIKEHIEMKAYLSYLDKTNKYKCRSTNTWILKIPRWLSIIVNVIRGKNVKRGKMWKKKELGKKDNWKTEIKRTKYKQKGDKYRQKCVWLASVYRCNAREGGEYGFGPKNRPWRNVHRFVKSKLCFKMLVFALHCSDEPQTIYLFIYLLMR